MDTCERLTYALVAQQRNYIDIELNKGIAWLQFDLKEMKKNPLQEVHNITHAKIVQKKF